MLENMRQILREKEFWAMGTRLTCQLIDDNKAASYIVSVHPEIGDFRM